MKGQDRWSAAALAVALLSVFASPALSAAQAFEDAAVRLEQNATDVHRRFPACDSVLIFNSTCSAAPYRSDATHKRQRRRGRRRAIASRICPTGAQYAGTMASRRASSTTSTSSTSISAIGAHVLADSSVVTMPLPRPLGGNHAGSNQLCAGAGSWGDPVMASYLPTRR